MPISETTRQLLWEDRISFNFYPPTCTCDMCGQPLSFDGVDIHHCIIRKGEVTKWPDERKNHFYNLMLVHRDVCHKKAHANPRDCAAIQIVRYGYAPIEAWVAGLPFKVPYMEWNCGLTEKEAITIVVKDYWWVPYDGNTALSAAE